MTDKEKRPVELWLGHWLMQNMIHDTTDISHRGYFADPEYARKCYHTGKDENGNYLCTQGLI